MLMITVRAPDLEAAFAPLGQCGSLGAERRVLAVAGIDPGLVGEPAEQLVLHVVDQRVEVLLGAERVADTAGEDGGTLTGYSLAMATRGDVLYARISEDELGLGHGVERQRADGRARSKGDGCEVV